MAITESVKLNISKGKKLQVPCIKCTGKTFHSVVLSADKDGHDDSDGYDIHWGAHYQIIQCLGCKSISFRRATFNSDDMMQIDADLNDWDYVIHETLFPSRIEGKKGLGDATFYLPLKVRRIYDETFQALTADSPILAGVGLRALVETICEEKEAKGANLLAKIDDLVTEKILTPSSAEILHKIRTLGNRAAHEIKPHSKTQLGIAMDVIEHLLKDVYIIPKQIETEFDEE